LHRSLATGCAPISYHAKSNIGDDMFTNLAMTNAGLRSRSVGLWGPGKPGGQWIFVSELLVNHALFVKTTFYRRIPNTGYERPGTAIMWQIMSFKSTMGEGATGSKWQTGNWTCWCWSTSASIRSSTECPAIERPWRVVREAGPKAMLDTLHTKRRSTGFSSRSPDAHCGSHCHGWFAVTSFTPDPRTGGIRGVDNSANVEWLRSRRAPEHSASCVRRLHLLAFVCIPIKTRED